MKRQRQLRIRRGRFLIANERGLSVSPNRCSTRERENLPSPRGALVLQPAAGARVASSDCSSVDDAPQWMDVGKHRKERGRVEGARKRADRQHVGSKIEGPALRLARAISRRDDGRCERIGTDLLFESLLLEFALPLVFETFLLELLYAHERESWFDHGPGERLIECKRQRGG